MAVRAGKSYGLFLDNTWRSSFDFGKESRNEYSFGAEGGPLDYYVFYGPEPKHVLEDYTWLTGTAPLPPLWSLGFQQSRYSYENEEQVRAIADRLRVDRIPADALYMDIDYQTKNRPFALDKSKFPDFAALVKQLAQKQFHLVMITDLHIAAAAHQNYAPYDTGVMGDHFVKKPGRIGVRWQSVAWRPLFFRTSPPRAPGCGGARSTGTSTWKACPASGMT